MILTKIHSPKLSVLLSSDNFPELKLYFKNAEVEGDYIYIFGCINVMDIQFVYQTEEESKGIKFPIEYTKEIIKI